MSAPIITIAEEIKTKLNDETFSQSFTAERVYVKYDRMEQIDGLEVWVQPVEMLVTPLTRDKDQNEYVISIGIFKRCETDAKFDEMIALIDEMYRYFRRYTFTNNSRSISVEMPTLYSPEYSIELGLFASVLNLTIIDKS